jgi:hypothetical protein
MFFSFLTAPQGWWCKDPKAYKVAFPCFFPRPSLKSLANLVSPGTIQDHIGVSKSELSTEKIPSFARKVSPTYSYATPSFLVKGQIEEKIFGKRNNGKYFF